MTAAVLTREEFGFVPAVTVTSLRDLGNWKSRADAIEQLRSLVDELPDAKKVLPSLGAFAGFLNKLLDDPNFKISLTTLQIWDTLLGKVGAAARPVVAQIVPTLIKKLGDNKHVVREANMSSIATLYKSLPCETIDALLTAFAKPETARGAATARFKEDALCAVVRAMLDNDHFPSKQVNPAELVSRLVAAAQAGGEGRDRDAVTDLSRTRATAVEALALACDRYGKDEAWRLVDCAEDFSGGVECSANLRFELTARFDDPRLPRVASDGLIEHCDGASGVLTKVRPEDALGRQLEILPASAQNSRSGSRAGSLFGGLGSTSKPSGFHASLLKMMGRSPRAPSSAVTASESTPSVASSEDTGSEAEAELARRQPRVGTGTLLGRAAAAANAKMSKAKGAGSRPAKIDVPANDASSDMWVSLSDDESESPESDANADPAPRRGFLAQPRRSALPSEPAARRADRPPGSPSGEKLNALKLRRAGSRENSLRAREGGLLRSTSGESKSRSGTFAPGGVATPDMFAKRQGSGSAGATTTPSRLTPTRPARQSGSQTLPARSVQRRLPLGGPGSGSAGGSGELARQGSSGSGSLRNSLVDRGAAPLDDPTTEELLPCPDPELALRRSMLLLMKASKAKRMDLNWQEQYESLLELRRLTVHHPRTVVPELHQLALATAPALDSLRSQIAKLAVALTREMARFLDPRALENELEYLVPPLVKRAGENTWLGGEADDAIGDFVEKLAGARVLAALLPHANHKAPAVRQSVSWHVERCCLNADAKTFSGSPPATLLLEKTFLALVPLLEEGQQDTRAMAKRALCHMRAAAPAADFERVVKQLPDAKARVARGVVEKGPPPLPTRGSGAGWTPRKTPASSRGTPGASSAPVHAGELLSQHAFGGRRAGSGSRGGAGVHGVESGGAWSPGGSGSPGSPGSRSPERDLPSPSPEALRQFHDALKRLAPRLTSSAWDARLDAVGEIEALAVSSASRRGASVSVFADDHAVVSLFDQLVPRLADGNAKVQTRALEAVTALVAALGDRAAPALSSLVPGLGGGVGSSNEKTKAAATESVDATLRCVSSHLLVQHVSHCVSYGAARSTPAMLDALTRIVEASFDEKPTLVSKYALPAAMSTLMNGRGAETNAAVRALLKELERKIGREPLLSHAAMRSAAAKAKLEEALS
jgi:hypothetical protein